MKFEFRVKITDFITDNIEADSLQEAEEILVESIREEHPDAMIAILNSKEIK